ncbi:hypothetical protein [Limimaricola cinnabarinus]|uniref:COG3904 family protein n=1 Tax=Limimaricola cinnabarinus TaxID=1125964 RepID=UPI0024932EDD|nr:hypothetical protein [Limimaricola cinnabarinus]
MSGPRRWLMAVLLGEAAIAAMLLGGDLARALPRLAWPSPAPQLTEPVRPGDQTRRFRPDRLPARPRRDGTPLPDTDEMPDRLRIGLRDGAVTLMGRIAPGDAARVSSELERAEPPPATAHLDSPGGSVADALAIGRMLRDLGIETRIAAGAVCLSACPYILAGGATRRVAEGAWVGVHQHYFDQNAALPAIFAIEDIQRGQGEVMGYLIEMGIDPALMRHALVTPPNEIYLLLPEELARYRLAPREPDPAG